MAYYYKRHEKDRFNPTLVRLRLPTILILPSSVRMFQSHAGSIEATPVPNQYKLAQIVSIPRWFD